MISSAAGARPLHIGFLAKDFLTWGGGVWFIQNLLRGLATQSAQDVRVTVLVPSDSTTRLLLARLARRLIKAVRRPTAIASVFRSPAPERSLWVNGVAALRSIVPRIVIYDGSERGLLRDCAKAQIDVLMPVMTPLRSSRLPWVGYLYDCQHRHYPEFFARTEIVVRDQAFRKMLQLAPVVFTNAEAVVSDLNRYFPESRSRIFALPFAPMIERDELAQAARDSVAARLEVAGGAPFFIVCNQFWIHKDHATAFRAFHQFVGIPQRSNYKLVCTGLTEDYRVPGHFDRLRRLVVELGIEERIVFTGYVSRARQQALLYAAEGLIQPTLFEGGPGGGAASDAIALGVPCLLSDIPVNRELVHPLASTFKVQDPEALASAMQRLADAPPPRPGPDALLSASQRYAERLGTCLLALAKAAWKP